jgi:hypothetical protein
VFLNGAQAIFAPSNGYLDSYDHVITRVDAEGRLDASFGLGGQAVIDVGEGPNPPHGEFGSQLLRQDDGKLLVLTTAYRADAQGHVNTPIVLARLQASGGSPGLIGIKGLEPIGHEGDGNIAVRIRRSGGAEGIVSVDYTTSSGSATSNLDFTPASGGLTWADGDREDKIVSINVAADAISEGRESFKLALSNASGGATLATSSVLISIDPPVVQSPPAQAPPPANNSGGGGGAMSWEFLLALMLAMLALNTCRRNRPHQGPPGGGIPVASKLGTSTFSALGSMIVF